MLRRYFVWLVLVAPLVLVSCVSSEYVFRAGKESIDLRNYVPVKYLDGVRQSLEQAGENAPELVKVLKTLSGEERDSAAFVIATMPLPDLISVKADYLVEHIRYTHLARRKYQWMKNIPDDIFRAYVLPYRVTEESITPHRKYFYEQFDPLVKDLDSMLEVAYQVNLWLGGKRKNAGRRVRFVQTEIRDMSPFAVLKTGYGRCEEMMIIYMCAVRAVGIPARMVWTPVWATCDNNHAWTEVWADGRWYPVGSCESSIKAACPATADQAPWFHKSAMRAAAIYSSRFGLPEDKSTLYKTYANNKYSYVNVLESYSKTCRLNITVLSPEGEPIAELPVVISVVNFGGFRGFASQQTDANGQVSFLTGIGGYFLSAGKDELRAWQFITTKANGPQDITLKLAPNNHPQGYFMLKYPTVKEAYRSFYDTPPPKTKHKPSERVKKMNAEHHSDAPPEKYYYEKFIPKEHPEVTALIKLSRFYNAMVKVLKSSGGNWHEIAAALKEVPQQHKDDLFWLVTRLNQVDSVGITREILLEHVKYARLARGKLPQKISDDIFRSYVLSHSIPYTHIYAWRKECYEIFSPLVKEDILSTAQAINEWIEKNIKVIDVKAGRYFCKANPAAVFKSKRSIKFDLTLASIAALRSVGIPARLKSQWVELFNGHKWSPFYPTDSKNLGNTTVDETTKKEYIKHGGMRIVTVQNGFPFRSNEPNCWIVPFENGTWNWTIRLWQQIGLQAGWMTVPPGEYLATAATRNSNGDVLVYCQNVHIESGNGLVINVPLDLPLEMRTDKERLVRNMAHVPDFTLKDRAGREYNLETALKDRHILLVFFTLETEPSVRMLPLIQATTAKAKEANVAIWMIFTDTDSDDDRLDSISLPVLLDKGQALVNQFIPEFEAKKTERQRPKGVPSEGRSPAPSGKDILPSVLLVNQTGEIVFWKEGYNLAIGTILNNAYAMLSGKAPKVTLQGLQQQVTTKEIASLKGLEYAREALQYLQSGEYLNAIKFYKKALEDFSDVSETWYNLACAYSRNGNVNEGLDALEKAVKLGYRDFKQTKKDQHLENLRQDERFKEIVE